MAGPEAPHVQRGGECGGEDGETLLTIIILKHTLTTWSPLQVFAMNMWKKFQSWKVVGFSNLPQFLQVMIDGYLTVCKILPSYIIQCFSHTFI